MLRSRLFVCLVVLALGLVAAPTALAGGFDDPVDQPKDVNGANRPDMVRVDASYDSAQGVVTFAATLAEPISGPKPANYMDSRWTLTLNCDGVWKSTNDPGQGTSMTINFSKSGAGSASGSVQGFDGTIPVTVTTSADGRSLTGSMQNANLVGHDYRCLDGYLVSFFRSSYTNPDSRYGAGCDCWYVSELDMAPSGYKWVGALPPACSDGVDNDGDNRSDFSTVYGDPGCASPDDTDEYDNCTDGDDNDHDGLADDRDPDCGKGAFENVKEMATADAKRLAKNGLSQVNREVKQSLKRGYGYRARCHRASPLSFRCSAGWLIGDLAYSAAVTVWYRPQLDDEQWYYRARVTRFDEYCAAMNKKQHRHRSCRKVFSVK